MIFNKGQYVEYENSMGQVLCYITGTSLCAVKLYDYHGRKLSYKQIEESELKPWKYEQLSLFP